VSETITVMYGYAEFKVKPPMIRKEIIKRRFWFDKIKYWIDFEFCSLGPIDTLDEAKVLLSYAHT